MSDGLKMLHIEPYIHIYFSPKVEKHDYLHKKHEH